MHPILTGYLEEDFSSEDGATLHYSSTGTGEPIVLLAGGPGFSGVVLQPLVEAIAEKHRGILFDQRGTGKSRGKNKLAPTTVNLTKTVSDVDDLRKSIGSGKITLLGHSWGGILAMAYTVQHPEQVSGLILLCSGGPTSEDRHLFQKNRDARLSPADVTNYEQATNPFEKFRAIWPGYLYDRSSLPAMDAFFKPDYYFPDIGDFLQPDLEKYDFTAQLRTFAGSVAILNGERDPVDPSTTKEINELFKNSTLSFIPRTGHYPWVEQPGTFHTYLERALHHLDVRNP
jgi:proline iminopeptidase